MFFISTTSFSVALVVLGEGGKGKIGTPLTNVGEIM